MQVIEAKPAQVSEAERVLCPWPPGLFNTSHTLYVAPVVSKATNG